MNSDEILKRYAAGQRDFSKAFLTRIDLTEADLSEVDLSEASLTQATLSGAILFRVNLSRANLHTAHLSRANISESDLSRADLARANLSAANLLKVILSGADLSGAILIGADLSGADLSGAILIGANLSAAVLTDVDLSGADLSGVILIGADLSGAILEGTILNGAVMPDGTGYAYSANISEAIPDGVTLAYEQPENLLRNANVALCRTKVRIGGGYEGSAVATDKWMPARFQFLQLKEDLWRAIQRQEFQIHYQPIVSLATGEITGFEALVRWQHPEYGLIFPSNFMPMAEETGLIVPIDQWVFRRACCQVRTWQTQFQSRRDPQFFEGENPSQEGAPPFSPLRINLNLSNKLFLQTDLIQQIATILKETDLDAQSLGLEIKLSVIMANAELAVTKLLQLKALGVQLHIVGFGMNYSSLGYLKCLPIDTLKIDRFLINRLGIDSKSVELVRTLVLLARNLSMSAIAEGVETAEQLIHLKGLNCEGQGYFFSKPINSEAAGMLLAAQC